jgi:hypothetical protein
MKNIPPDKYNVAWFKLAECVSRGEKERALGVYRLLAHSLHDSAFARQLQGDIFIAFHDSTSACQHYYAAAELYDKDGRVLEAAALGEHLVTLQPNNKAYRAYVIKLYMRLHNKIKAIAHSLFLYNLSIDDQEYTQAVEAVDALQPLLTINEMVAVQQQLCASLLEKKNIPSSCIFDQAKKVVKALGSTGDAQQMQRFLSTIQAVDENCHAQLCALLQEAAS